VKGWVEAGIARRERERERKTKPKKIKIKIKISNKIRIGIRFCEGGWGPLRRICDR
jgi:hypothetical protein